MSSSICALTAGNTLRLSVRQIQRRSCLGDRLAIRSSASRYCSLLSDHSPACMPFFEFELEGKTTP